MENKSPTKNRFVIIIMTIIAVAGIATSIFLYIQYQKTQKILNNPTIQGQLEAKDLVKKVSRIMLLPKNEEPTVATVSDYKKLKDQPFFKNAHNGDKVLIYTKAAIAILYDPKQDKILAVVPVNLGQTKVPFRIALYNGTSTAGLTNSVEQQLKGKLNDIVISRKENAAKSDYQTTTVVVLNENARTAASTIADYLKATVANLPTEESKPNDADIVVIIGNDKVPQPSPERSVQ